jgi:lipopolysaccharide export system permease protein
VKKEKEMTLGELREHLRTLDKKKKYYFKALTVYHSKFSIPFACFAMGILAVPLGVQSKSAKRSFGVGLGVFFFLGYYIILSAGEVYGKTGLYPPVIGMWAPNIIMGGIGCFLLIQCARERAIDISGLFSYFTRNPQHGSGPGDGAAPPANP